MNPSPLVKQINAEASRLWRKSQIIILRSKIQEHSVLLFDASLFLLFPQSQTDFLKRWKSEIGGVMTCGAAFPAFSLEMETTAGWRESESHWTASRCLTVFLANERAGTEGPEPRGEWTIHREWDMGGAERQGKRDEKRERVKERERDGLHNTPKCFCTKED